MEGTHFEPGGMVWARQHKIGGGWTNLGHAKSEVMKVATIMAIDS